MPRNVEIKARVRDRAGLLERIAALATEGPFELQQEDVFFPCRDGRLKLRKLPDGSGELIFYQREDAPDPRPSDYVKVPSCDPVALEEALARAWGRLATVRKVRQLYFAERTRIHLDRVEGLGDFVELEVVLAEGEALAAGAAEAARLIAALGLAADDLVSVAYVDLLLRAP